MKDQIRYTTINQIARKKLKLSLVEYCFLDLVYILSNNPESIAPGWCYAIKQYLADEMDISIRMVFKMMEKLLEKNDEAWSNLLVQEIETKYLKTTPKWYKNVVIKQYAQSAVDMQNMHTDYAQSAVDAMHKVHSLDKDDKDKYIKDSYKDNKEIYKEKFLEFVFLTKIEYQKLIDHFGQDGVDERIAKLNNYIGMKGRKYKSHYHTILAWEDNRKASKKLLQLEFKKPPVKESFEQKRRAELEKAKKIIGGTS